MSLLTLVFITTQAQTEFLENNDIEQKTSVTVDNNTNNQNVLIMGIGAPDCPNDNCYNGKLYTTYKTEYCVGVHCRTRTLYRCNMDRDHEYWIYKD
jgi:hypothetical protein